MKFKLNSRGVTLIEMMATVAIISILAVCVLPLSRVMYVRTHEIELKRNLRTIRTAIDRYKQAVSEKKISVAADSSGYPKNLEILVKGVELQDVKKTRIKFLRRIPEDPMTEEGRWGLRSYADEPDSTTWGGQDVYDVYSLSPKKALDGSSYSKW